MIDRRKKMIFAAGSRQCRAELAITQRAAKRDETADYPKEQEREPGTDINKLKAKAGEDASANNVGNNDGTGRCKADRAQPSREAADRGHTRRRLFEY